MTALLGKLLLLCGCTALGVGRGLALRRRTACLRAAARALEALARELSFSLRPLTELMAEAEGQSDGAVRDLFAACRRRFAEDGGESWARSWTDAVRTCLLPVRDEDRALLAEAGTVLGRYDGARQQEGLAALLARLDARIGEAHEEERRLFRPYAAVGVAAGLFCAILL